MRRQVQLTAVFLAAAGVPHGVEPFEVGRDSIAPVNPDYKAKGSFPFTGTMEKITFAATPAKK